jgi:transglutaminase-like putative cysteine protease
MTNHRLTFAAGVAVVAAALSLLSLLEGGNWLLASIGAVAAAAIAGTLTRLTTLQAAIAACVAVLLAFAPPLAGYGWPGRVAALIVLALAALSATGARLPRLFAALATYLAAELLYLNLVFSRRFSFGAVIPTRKSLAQLAALPSRLGSAFKYRPPVQATKPVELIAVAGIALIAIAVDILAVRLRRPALAGLPLLLLFSVPVATSLKNFGILQTLGFGIGIAAYLALLSADGRQRLRMWGRLVTIHRTHAGDETGQGPDTRQLAATGRRVGLTAVAVAMVVPVFLAGSTPKDVFAKTADGRGDGGGIGIPGSLDPLNTVGEELADQNPVLELTYRTSSPQPQLQYLQAYVLNYMSDGSWKVGASGGLRVGGQKLPYNAPAFGAAGAGVPTATVRTTISVAGTYKDPLPLPYAPASLQFGRLPSLEETQGTLMVFSQQPLSRPQFTVISKEADPSAQQLDGPVFYPASVIRAYGNYNGPDARQLLVIAKQHTAGDTTALQKADSLQQWLTSSSFTYTLHAKWQESGPWLLQFLTTKRRGDCEQFAPAFAVLARLLGIPSRVATGFTAGTQVGPHQWQVTSADAHAWPELYFPQAGWLRFEPTPGGPGQQGTAMPPAYTGGAGGGSTGSKRGVTPSNPNPSVAPSVRPSRGLGGKLHQLQAGAGPIGSATASSSFPVGIAIAVVIFLLLAWPGLARWLTTRRRWLAASRAGGRAAPVAWRELLDYLTDYGISWLPSGSPRTPVSDQPQRPQSSGSGRPRSISGTRRASCRRPAFGPTSSRCAGAWRRMRPESPGCARGCCHSRRWKLPGAECTPRTEPSTGWTRRCRACAAASGGRACTAPADPRAALA